MRCKSPLFDFDTTCDIMLIIYTMYHLDRNLKFLAIFNNDLIRNILNLVYGLLSYYISIIKHY